MTVVYINFALNLLENPPESWGALDFEVREIEKSRDRSLKTCAKWRELNWLETGK